MKRNLIYLLFLLPALFLLPGCQKNELGNPLPSTISDFSYSVSNESYAPCKVTFTNHSINANGYLWDFGNGQTSTEANPVVHFETPGLYTVTLTCTQVNDVHYNKLVKTMVINIKDILAGKTQVLYFTSRGPAGGNGHMVILDDGQPIVQDFEATDMVRPYGIAADTAHGKVYITDFSVGAIYRFDADGKNPLKILDVNVIGQEIVGDPEGIFVLGDKIYWGRTGGIYCANLDGTDPKEFITDKPEIEYPIDMQYDEASRKIYLCNDKTDYSGGYFTINFDGTGLTEHILDIDGTAIEVDFETGKTYMAIYASDGSPVTENGIFVCNLDGTNLSKIGDYGTKATWGVAIDYTREKLFWSYKISNSNPDGKIIRANLDGTGQEDWVTGVSPHAMQIVWIKL